MSKKTDVLALYATAADLTEEILLSAEANEWDAVVEIGKRYIQVIESIKLMGQVPEMDSTERARKYELLVRILDNDARTKSLTMPSLERLGRLLFKVRVDQRYLSSCS